MFSPLQSSFSFPYLDDETARLLVEPGGFADPRAAARCVRDLATLPGAQPFLAAIWPHLLNALTSAASPDRALVNLARFIQGAAKPTQLLETLANDPRTTEVLVTLFAGSQFLTEILLRNPEYLPRLADRGAVAQIKSAALFAAEARQAVDLAGDDTDTAGAFEALRRFQRWEFLRIGVSDLCGGNSDSSIFFISKNPHWRRVSF